MDTFEIEFLEEKTTKTGKKKADASLRNVATGVQCPNATIWEDFPDFVNLRPGDTVKGSLVGAKDPKYGPTLYPPKKQGATRNFGPNKAISAAQEKKAEYIKEAQERKDNSIAYFNSLNTAIQFVTAFRSEMDLQNQADIFDAVLKYRDRFLQQWDEYNNVKEGNF